MNGDGKADVVGIGNSGLFVATSTGTTSSPIARWAAAFGVVDGWNSDRHVRGFADVNGDGMADVIGYGDTGVYVSLSSGKDFGAQTNWYNRLYEQSSEAVGYKCDAGQSTSTLSARSSTIICWVHDRRVRTDRARLFGEGGLYSTGMSKRGPPQGMSQSELGGSSDSPQ